MSSPVLQTLLKAVMIRSAVTIKYNNGSHAETRDIQPIGLYASEGYWYCPAYCFLRENYRLFRGDRIRSADLNPSVECLDEVDARSVRDWNEPELRKMDKITLTVELTPGGVRTLETSSWFGRSIERKEDGSGFAAIQVPKENLPFFANMIWGLGEDAKIVGPEEAVDEIRKKIGKMVRAYSST